MIDPQEVLGELHNLLNDTWLYGAKAESDADRRFYVRPFIRRLNVNGKRSLAGDDGLYRQRFFIGMERQKNTATTVIPERVYAITPALPFKYTTWTDEDDPFIKEDFSSRDAESESVHTAWVAKSNDGPCKVTIALKSDHQDPKSKAVWSHDCEMIKMYGSAFDNRPQFLLEEDVLWRHLRSDVELMRKQLKEVAARENDRLTEYERLVKTETDRFVAQFSKDAAFLG